MSDLLAAYRAAMAAEDAAEDEYAAALDHAEQQKRAHGTRSREYETADEAAEQAWVVYIEKWAATDLAYHRWNPPKKAPPKKGPGS